MCNTHVKAHPAIYLLRDGMFTSNRGRPAWLIIAIVMQNIGDWLHDYCFYYEASTTMSKGEHIIRTYKTILKLLDDIDELRTGVCI